MNLSTENWNIYNFNTLEICKLRIYQQINLKKKLNFKIYEFTNIRTLEVTKSYYDYLILLIKYFQSDYFESLQICGHEFMHLRLHNKLSS